MKLSGPPEMVDSIAALIQGKQYCPHCGSGNLIIDNSTVWEEPKKGSNMPMNYQRRKCQNCGFMSQHRMPNFSMR